MAIDPVSFFLDAFVSFATDLDFEQFELLLQRGSRVVHVGVHVFDIHDDEFRKSFSSQKRLERRLPVVHLVYFESLHRCDVDYVDKLGYFVHQHQWSDSSHKFRCSFRQHHEVISADWCKLDAEGMFLFGRSISLVMANELLRLIHSATYYVLDEIHKFCCAGFICKLEI